MVRINRNVTAPAQLLRYQQRWTLRWQTICDGRTGGDWGTRAAKALLQKELFPLAYGKCAFCEGMLGVTADLEVEHYRAKTLSRELAFEWTNLLPACRLCNRSKGDNDHGGALLKPDNEDPEPFFWINADTGKLEANPTLIEEEKQRATLTIDLCGLQRPALCTKRVETMQRVGRWLRQVISAGALTQELREEWESLSNPSTEFKLAVRHQLLIFGQAELAEIDRRRFLNAPH